MVAVSRHITRSVFTYVGATIAEVLKDDKTAHVSILEYDGVLQTHHVCANQPHP